jgi:hypothetical protein
MDWPVTGLFRVHPIFPKAHRTGFFAPQQVTKYFRKYLISPGNFLQGSFTNALLYP